MTDTTILPTAPAYVQISDHHNDRCHNGISDKDRMALGSDFLNASLSNLSNQVNSNGAANSLATEKVGAANELAIEKTASAIGLANALGFTNTQNLLISGFKDSRYDACENTNKITMQAAQNHALALAQAAECCCEIKELIREDGEKTRSLVSSINADNLAVQLADAKNQITLLQLKAK